ncbi:MAG: hypothetical protein KGZ58_12195 [Ignavibacteriales bacterium]|nr:hypothetical protein [Ignavibacteriales bacterium]
MRKFILGSLGTITLLSCIFFVMTGASNRPHLIMEDRPSIYGIVKDEATGDPLLGIPVYAVNDKDQRWDLYTNEETGDYRLPDNIPEGIYTVVAKIVPPPDPQQGNWYGAIATVNYSCGELPCAIRQDLHCTYYENSPE